MRFWKSLRFRFWFWTVLGIIETWNTVSYVVDGNALMSAVGALGVPFALFNAVDVAFERRGQEIEQLESEIANVNARIDRLNQARWN